MNIFITTITYDNTQYYASHILMHYVHVVRLYKSKLVLHTKLKNVQHMIFLKNILHVNIMMMSAKLVRIMMLLNMLEELLLGVGQLMQKLNKSTKHFNNFRCNLKFFRRK